MELNEYQKKAMSTCLPSSNNFSYMMLNLVGEVGEFSSKVAKNIRKEKIYIDDRLDVLGRENPQYGLGCIQGVIPNFDDCDSDNRIDGRTGYLYDLNYELRKEAGDILWQLSGLCSVMGWELEDIAQMNLEKLQARKQAGTIDGSGDGITDRVK